LACSASPNYEQLCRNIELNQLTKVSTYCLAISDAVGESQLKIGKATSGSRLYNEKYDKNSSSQAFVNVSTNTFEAFLNNIGVKPEKQPTLLKMDCEGAEFRILTEESIDLFRGFDMITFEYHSNAGNPRNLAKLFKRIGMNVQMFPDHCHPSLGIMVASKPYQVTLSPLSLHISPTCWFYADPVMLSLAHCIGGLLK